MKSKSLFILLLILTSSYISAETVSFDDGELVYYAEKGSGICEVGGRLPSSNAHSITIPEYVTHTIWKNTVIEGKSTRVIERIDTYIPVKIHTHAFMGCSDIVAADLGHVSEIEDGAFFGTSIVAVASAYVVTIGQQAFGNCYFLTSATFPAAVTIGEGAFINCTTLQAFVLPPTLKELGAWAFSGCVDLDYVTCTCPLLKEIPTSCFQNCEDLREFNFPTMKLNAIGSWAFSGCGSLDEISIPDDITDIGVNAFSNCKSLRKVYINGAHTTIGMSAFAGCTNLSTLRIVANEYTPVMRYVLNNSQESLTVVELKDNSTFIRDDCFSGFKAIHTVDMREGIISIGERAFSDCSALKTISLPHTLERIEAAAFFNSSITEIEFPKQLYYIGNEAFRYCELKEIHIPATVDTVGFHCFDTNEHLQRVSIEGTPEWLTNGGSSMAFNRCTEIMYIEMMCHRDTYNPNSLFYSSSGSVEEFRALEGSTAIGYNNPYYTGSQGAFNSFTNLKKVTIPEGVEVIGMAAFENCTSLTEIALPHSVDSIGYRAFAGSGLEEITLPTNIQWVDEEAFYKCKQLQKADMGGLEILPQYVLSNCQSLTCLIANNVRVLQRQACYNTSLVSVYLPAQCDSLLKDAIPFNTTVKKVVCKAVTPPFASSMYNTFYVNSDIHLYVPSESIAAYKVAPLWQQFAFIEPLENNPADTDDCHEQDNTTPTALEEYKTPATISPLKMIDNGSMIIVMPDGTKYDVMGEKK